MKPVRPHVQDGDSLPMSEPRLIRQTGRYEGSRDEGLALQHRLREAVEAAERYLARRRRKR